MPSSDPLQPATAPVLSPSRRLKLSHLRLLAAIAAHGQVSSAAQALGIAQPAASRLLADAEALLGVPLFLRQPRGLQPTRFGEALIRRARSILAEIDATEQEIHGLRLGQSGRVAIGAVTGAALRLAIPALLKARAAAPDLEVSLQVETSEALGQLLADGRLDFMLARQPEDPAGDFIAGPPIGTEEAAIIVRPGHPLASRKDPIALPELAGADWIFQTGRSLLRRGVEAAFIAAGLQPPPARLTTGSILMTLAFLADSDSLAPVGDDTARILARLGGSQPVMIRLPLAERIVLPPYSLIRRSDRLPSPAAERLEALILAEAGKGGP